MGRFPSNSFTTFVSLKVKGWTNAFCKVSLSTWKKLLFPAPLGPIRTDTTPLADSNSIGESLLKSLLIPKERIFETLTDQIFILLQHLYQTFFYHPIIKSLHYIEEAFRTG